MADPESAQSSAQAAYGCRLVGTNSAPPSMSLSFLIRLTPSQPWLAAPAPRRSPGPEPCSPAPAGCSPLSNYPPGTAQCPGRFSEFSTTAASVPCLQRQGRQPWTSEDVAPFIEPRKPSNCTTCRVKSHLFYDKKEITMGNMSQKLSGGREIQHIFPCHLQCACPSHQSQTVMQW